MIDSNVLLLYVVDVTDRRRIQKFKRTEKYTAENFGLPSALMGDFRTLITTAHVLAGVSNPAGSLFGSELYAVREF